MMELESHLKDTVDDTACVGYVLEAIDKLLDAIEGLDAPITRELLASAMMALVHECRIAPPPTRLN